MKKLFLIAMMSVALLPLYAQEKKAASKTPVDNTLPDIKMCILQAQENVSLFVQNLDSNSKEQNVNAIIIDFQQYIDSLKGTRNRADAMLVKNFAPLRLFFLTTTNKTSVATSFLSVGPPFRFCAYNDTAALYVGAVKNGELYNLAKSTEKRIARSALLNCLLPSLGAFNEFKGTEVKYIALSIYYGCKDTREGASKEAATAYCLTLVARLSDIQDYGAGLITAKGLLANATLYLSDTEDRTTLKQVQITVE